MTRALRSVLLLASTILFVPLAVAGDVDVLDGTLHVHHEDAAPPYGAPGTDVSVSITSTAAPQENASITAGAGIAPPSPLLELGCQYARVQTTIVYTCTWLGNPGTPEAPSLTLCNQVYPSPSSCSAISLVTTGSGAKCVIARQWANDNPSPENFVAPCVQASTQGTSADPQEPKACIAVVYFEYFAPESPTTLVSACEP